MPIIKVICVGVRGVPCGKEFDIPETEQKFFASKKGDDGKPLSLPKRCIECRHKKREENRLAKIREESPFKGVYDHTFRGRKYISDKDLIS